MVRVSRFSPPMSRAKVPLTVSRSSASDSIVTTSLTPANVTRLSSS